MHRQHPVTGCHVRCQFVVDVGSRAPMVTVFEETRECSTRDNQTSECKEPLLDCFVHRGRPRLIRMDPDGCYMINAMLDTLHHDFGINTNVIPGEALETIHHRRHHETGEADNAHLRAGSGTSPFLSRVSSASCDGPLTFSQKRRTHSFAASLRARTSSDRSA